MLELTAITSYPGSLPRFSLDREHDGIRKACIEDGRNSTNVGNGEVGRVVRMILRREDCIVNRGA
jgi:hypothetical protein